MQVAITNAPCRQEDRQRYYKRAMHISYINISIGKTRCQVSNSLDLDEALSYSAFDPDPCSFNITLWIRVSSECVKCCYFMIT